MVFDVDPEERLKMSLILKIYDDDLDGDEFLGQCKVSPEADGQYDQPCRQQHLARASVLSF